MAPYYGGAADRFFLLMVLFVVSGLGSEAEERGVFGRVNNFGSAALGR